MADPLTVRHVRDAPLTAFQSPLPQETAEFAEQARTSDGAPEALALPETPTPPWLRHRVALKPYWPPPVPATEMVMPLAVAPTTPFHRYAVQFDATVMDCNSVHVIEPPVAVGVLRV
jgi:hypothetical protein